MEERKPHIEDGLKNENSDRKQELGWIEENRALFYTISTVAAEIIGRGLLIVDTTIQRPQGGHPISYRTEGEIESNETLEKLLQEYNPHREFIVTVLKPNGQTSTYLETAPIMGWWDSMETQTAMSGE
ncbi:MAG: hypothetical protein IPM53_17950 [Anaerolineaceae bacterium]|nr:hypothetical protein [Anaerolineaceae bacterium]